MSGEDAHAWLTIAVGEVAHLPRDILEIGCTAARRTCTHHGQIVPAILRESEDLLASRRRTAARDTIPEDRHLPPPDQWHPTREELDELKGRLTRKLKAER